MERRSRIALRFQSVASLSELDLIFHCPELRGDLHQDISIDLRRNPTGPHVTSIVERQP